MTELMGKIQLTLNPMLPATCVVCGRSANGVVRFLDFQMQLEYYGAVVICEDCGKELVSVLDFVPAVALQEIQQEFEFTEDKLSTVREENERLRGALDSILLIRPDISSDSSLDVGVDGKEFEQPTLFGASKE